VDTTLCVGCRYCMIACPFQIAAYEYDDPLMPRVMKCTFCYEYVKKGDLPACVKVCPMEVMTFGKRSELLKLARKKIEHHPGRYVDYIYGEEEVGGTSWLYLASQPFEKIGFPRLGKLAPPRITEGLQHGLYKYLWAPLTLYVVLGGIMWASEFFGEKRSFKVKGPKGSGHEKGGKQ
ncbi:MAG TPA: 4Fe-4S dicluster domain-containing protein, partial [Desulfobacterales bacterium]|nr:4Fe-4S dicluster domain-containing protein [Desulfobacterales bacterium]